MKWKEIIYKSFRTLGIHFPGIPPLLVGNGVCEWCECGRINNCNSIHGSNLRGDRQIMGTETPGVCKIKPSLPSIQTTQDALVFFERKFAKDIAGLYSQYPVGRELRESCFDPNQRYDSIAPIWQKLNHSLNQN
jgi:hypothetical protein